MYGLFCCVSWSKDVTMLWFELFSFKKSEIGNDQATVLRWEIKRNGLKRIPRTFICNNWKCYTHYSRAFYFIILLAMPFAGLISVVCLSAIAVNVARSSVIIVPLYLLCKMKIVVWIVSLEISKSMHLRRTSFRCFTR